MSRIRNNAKTSNRKVRKQIPINLEVTVANNTSGTFVYEPKNQNVSLSLQNRGDEDYVSFEELRKMRKWLENFDLVITSVNSNEFTILDVARNLRIDDVYEQFFDLILQIDADSYEDEVTIDIDEIDGFILEEDDEEVFKKALESKLRKTVIVECVSLYREGALKDYTKMALIEKTRPETNADERAMFWKDMEI